MLWRPLGVESLCWVESLLPLRNRKIMVSFMSWTQVGNVTQLTLYVLMVCIEHIKYPDSSKPPASNNTVRKSSINPQTGSAVQNPTSAQNNGVINGERATSPNSGDPLDPRRAISPTGPKKPNGLGTQLAPNGKPKRPRRDGDDDLLGTDDGHGTDATASESVHRAPSPENVTRAKSPGSTRAMSPALQMSGEAAAQPSIAARLQERARSPSPIVDRTKPPPDAFYNGVRSPTQNGFGRPGSSTGHGGHGSTGNITADLIRDLKAKEAEVDAMKIREIWMKAALSKASRSGFVYEDREADEGNLGLHEEDRKIAELVLNFKQFKAQIQVRLTN